MVAHFYYNIPRQHGKYGLAVSVYNSAEDRHADYNDCAFSRRVAYFKTYKHQTADGCNIEAQIEELKTKVLRQYPNCEFDNL